MSGPGMTVPLAGTVAAATPLARMHRSTTLTVPAMDSLTRRPRPRLRLRHLRLQHLQDRPGCPKEQ